MLPPGGNGVDKFPGVTLRAGLKSTEPRSNTRLLLPSNVAVRAPLPAKFSLAEKFSPSSEAISGSLASVKMYQMDLPLPARDP